MLMPLDILNRKFRKGFGGYNTEEVDSFMEGIAEDYESIYKENIELKDKITILNEGIQHYKNIEHTLQNTLLIAQKTSEDLKNTAYQTGESIKKEAELEAQAIKNQSKLQIEQMNREYEFLRKQYEAFKIKFRAMLTSQLDALEQQPIDSEELYRQVHKKVDDEINNDNININDVEGLNKVIDGNADIDSELNDKAEDDFDQTLE